MIEEWKPIVGYEDLYMVSSNGQVKSLGRYSYRKDGRFNYYPPKMMHLAPDAKGYMRVRLTKDGKSVTRLVHRLVAEAFIPNPNMLPQVNHINELKHDNRVENLEWMSCSDNVNHATGKIRCGQAHEFPVIMIDANGDCTEFTSATAAARELGIVSQGIQSCCVGRFPTYKGFQWRYKDRHRARIEVEA